MSTGSRGWAPPPPINLIGCYPSPGSIGASHPASMNRSLHASSPNGAEGGRPEWQRVVLTCVGVASAALGPRFSGTVVLSAPHKARVRLPKGLILPARGDIRRTKVRGVIPS